MQNIEAYISKEEQQTFLSAVEDSLNDTFDYRNYTGIYGQNIKITDIDEYSETEFHITIEFDVLGSKNKSKAILDFIWDTEAKELSLVAGEDVYIKEDEYGYKEQLIANLVYSIIENTQCE